MSTEVISVDEDAPISKVATLLETRHIKRVPVTLAPIAFAGRPYLVRLQAARQSSVSTMRPSILPFFRSASTPLMFSRRSV